MMNKLRWHWQNLNRDHRNKTHGRPWHGRAWVDFGDESARVEWDVLSQSCHVHVEFDGAGGNPETLRWSVALPPVALYFGLNLKPERLLTQLGQRIAAAVRDMGSEYSGARFDLSVHGWSLWWKLGVDTTGWVRSRPRWRDGSVNVLDAVLGKATYKSELLEKGTIRVHMPEGSYLGTCELRRDVWSRPRWPDLVVFRAHVDMTEPVPFPGKGENSWDQGEDAINGTCVEAKTFAQAIASITETVLSRRERRSGRNWTPQPKRDVG